MQDTPDQKNSKTDNFYAVDVVKELHLLYSNFSENTKLCRGSPESPTEPI